MKKIRIIPRLDIKGPNVVKGINLEGVRVVGDPEKLAKLYYEQGADELLYMDVVASLYNRKNILEIVQKASKGIFIPLSVGGGIRNLEDIKSLLRVGADKVAINTAAVKMPKLVTDAAKMFGSQCIIGSIEAKEIKPKKWEVYVDNGREKTGLDTIEWAKKLEELGAGEILITSVDYEGTERGYDLDLIKKVTNAVKIPVIALGGAGSISHIMDCIKKAKPDAISMASILHYKRFTISEIKEQLNKNKILVRMVYG